MNRGITIFFILTFCSFAIKAQGEFNNWYFGSAALNFSSAVPTVLTNSAMGPKEGSSSISDENGNLLFYTDGIKVWDNIHQQMPNGFGLNGNESTTQTLIVPRPGNPDEYYIFTADEEGDARGFCYSIVNMTSNGGLGDITTKNILLYTPTCEKIAAIKHRNGCDIWVVSHKWQSNNFYAYKVTNAGVSTTPVISSVGRYHGSTGPVTHPGGYMKANQQNNKLALGLLLSPSGTTSLEILDFNNATGIVSNPIILTTGLRQTYGVEFSASGKYLYANGGRLYQYDLTSGSQANINASRIDIAPGTYGALQIAPNGKIYMANRIYIGNAHRFLSVINNPEASGVACNFVPNGQSLNGRATILGLPTFMASKFSMSSENILVTDTCEGNQTSFLLTDSAGIISATWNFGDPVSGSNNIINDIFTNHQYSSTGTYTVTLILNYECKIDTLYKTVHIIPGMEASISSTGSAACTGLSDVVLSVNITGGNNPFYYSWSNGSTSTTISNTPIGTHSVTITDAEGCKAFSEKTIAPEIAYILFVPNTFTPNNDGVNDIFLPQGNCIEKYELTIFDRWGNLIFTSTDPLAGWTGATGNQTAAIGTYAWRIITKDYLGEDHHYKGHVNLLK